MNSILRILKLLFRIEKLLLEILVNLKKGIEKEPVNPERLLHSDEVREILKISASTLYRYRKQGILVPTGLDGKFYRQSDVLRHMNNLDGSEE